MWDFVNERMARVKGQEGRPKRFLEVAIVGASQSFYLRRPSASTFSTHCYKARVYKATSGGMTDTRMYDIIAMYFKVNKTILTSTCTRLRVSWRTNSLRNVHLHRPPSVPPLCGLPTASSYRASTRCN